MTYSLSVSDLTMVDGFEKAYHDNDRKYVYETLYRNGMNIRKPFRVNVCYHRNLQGKAVMGERYEGEERTDKFWLATGAATVRNNIGGKDGSLMRELDQLSRNPIRSAEGMYDSKDYFVTDTNVGRDKSNV